MPIVIVTTIIITIVRIRIIRMIIDNKNINDIIATFLASIISIISHNNDGCINNKNYYNSNYLFIVVVIVIRLLAR